MRKLPIVIALLCFGTGAWGADIATKGPVDPFAAGYPVKCGMYYGINTEGYAAPVSGASGAALGGAIGGTLGYTCASSPSTFWFVEGLVDFQTFAGIQNGVGLGGPLHLEQRAAFGGPIANMLNIFPNLNLPAVPSLPALPSGVTAGSPNGYIFVGVSEDDISANFGAAAARDWAVSPEAGVGILSRLSNNVVIDVWAGVALQSNEFCMSVGGSTVACPKMATGVRTGLSLKY